MKTLPKYLQVEAALKLVNAEIEPSELHGTLVAMICGDLLKSNKEPLLQLFPESITVSKPTKQLLLDIYSVTSTQLASVDLNFQLLLPEDDASLEMRSKALGLWCHGFMSGLGVVGLQETQLKNDNVKEALTDLLHIAGLRSESEVEEEEQAFFEISEYVRMSAVMIYTCLQEELESDGDSLQNDGQSLH